MEGNMNVNGGKCTCSHHKMTPIFVVLFAVVFLLGNLNILSADFVNIAWPIIVGVAGLMKLTGAGCKCC
jgi:hypothetical protein